MSDIGGAAGAIEGILDDDNPEATFDDEHQEEITEEITQDVEEGDPEALEEQLTEDGADLEEEEAADDEPEEDDEDAGGYTSLEEVAEALEMPLEEFLDNFELTFNAAGETVTAKLSDLQQSYQKDADYTKKSMKLADERKDFEATREAKRKEFEANSAGLSQAIQATGQMIIQEMQSPEMQRLRQDDPAEWSARDQEARRKLQYLDSVRDQAAQQFNSFREQSQAEFMREQGKILESEVEGWGEEKLTDAVDTIRSLGFSDEEIPNIGDARLIKAALELRTLRQENEALKAQKSKGDLTAKKVKKLPTKTVKAGAGGQGKKTSKVGQLKRKLKSTPRGRENLNAAANVIEELI